MAPEIWMGSAHIREYFGIFAFILLFYDPKNDTNFKKIITKQKPLEKFEGFNTITKCSVRF